MLSCVAGKRSHGGRSGQWDNPLQRVAMTFARFFFAVLLLCASAVFAQDHPAVSAPPNTVYVGADGKFESVPDTAQIQFNVSVQKETSPAAFQSAATNLEQVRQVLRNNGIDPRPRRLDFFLFNPPMNGSRSSESLDIASPPMSRSSRKILRRSAPSRSNSPTPMSARPKP